LGQGAHGHDDRAPNEYLVTTYPLIAACSDIVLYQGARRAVDRAKTRG
jgi:hypothetical protein